LQSNPLARLLQRQAPLQQPSQQHPPQKQQLDSNPFLPQRPTRFRPDAPSVAPADAGAGGPARLTTQLAPVELPGLSVLAGTQQEPLQRLLEQQQQPPRRQPPANTSTAVAPAVSAAAVAPAAAPAAAPGPVALGADWTLPPTPSCIYAFSPDSPAAAAGPAAAAALAAGPAAEPPGVALRRLPEFSYDAETPLLFAQAEAEQQEAAAAEGRQLFVAETPCDAGRGSGAGPAAAGGSASLATSKQCGTPAALAGALDGAAAHATPAQPDCISALQLQLPNPVLQVVSCADGRHLALLLGSYAPAGEPAEVLVLRLPAEARAHAAAPSSGGDGLQVVGSVLVQRSQWGEGVELTANCLQLACTDR
jgi:hypothetical protein